MDDLLPASDLYSTFTTLPPNPSTVTTPAPLPSSTSTSPCSDSPNSFRASKIDGSKLWRDHWTWIAKKSTNLRCLWEGITSIYPVTFDSCDPRRESSIQFRMEYNGKKSTRDCGWVGNKATTQRCKSNGVEESCCETCVCWREISLVFHMFYVQHNNFDSFKRTIVPWTEWPNPMIKNITIAFVITTTFIVTTKRLRNLRGRRWTVWRRRSDYRILYLVIQSNDSRNRKQYLVFEIKCHWIQIVLLHVNALTIPTNHDVSSQYSSSSSSSSIMNTSFFTNTKIIKI